MSEDRQWNVDESVLCKGKFGIVRFVGETQFADGIWVGIELPVPAGRNDGSLDGVGYFGPVEPNHGIFMRASSKFLQPFSSAEAAAVKIQNQFRRRRDSANNFYRQARRALNELESKTECDFLRAALDCTTTSKILEEEGRTRPSTAKPEEDSQTQTLQGQPAIWLEHVPDGEGGTRPAVSRSCLEAVIRYLKQPDRRPLASSSVSTLIRGASALLQWAVPAALAEIDLPPPPGRCIVVGDTHGQLADVLWILFEHGEPSEANVYVFNGDVCDRGMEACDILLLLFLYKLWKPRCVHINRGNHEDPSMNEFYGFYDECCDKWGRKRGTELYDNFNGLFQLLPLYTLIGNSVFVVHGGLPRTQCTLSSLREVEYRRPVPTHAGDDGQDAMIFDSMWSDPQRKDGIGKNPRGECIITFGPDVTARFMDQEQIRLVVRSHQVPDSGHGFEWHHGERLVTIFSGSNYCGDYGNLGAVLVLSQGEDDQIIEHWAPTIEELVEWEQESDAALARVNAQAKQVELQRRALKIARARMESDIARHVQELFVRHKTELFEYWSSVDTSPRGIFLISTAAWREGCAKIIDSALPWVKLQDLMGVVEPAGETGSGEPVVHYVKFLTRYRVAFDAAYGLSAGGWERAIWSKLMETLLYADLPLREALAAFDSTHDGLVSGVEFSKLLESCHVDIPPLQARALLRTIISHPNDALPDDLDPETEVVARTAGRACVWDVLGRLQVSLPIAHGRDHSESEAAWAIPKLKALAIAVLKDAQVTVAADSADWPVPKLLAAWFETADRSQNGFLEITEFKQGLRRLAPDLERGGCSTDDESLERLCRYCDVVGNGHINYFELLNSLTWEDSLGDDLKSDLMETIHAAIYFNIAPIRRGLQGLDPERCGRVTPEDCATALTAVHKALQQDRGREVVGNLTRSQIDAIANHLPVEDDGRIDYERFLRSFRVVDTHALA